MRNPIIGIPLGVALVCGLGLFSSAAAASNTLRVGSQVLTTGDSAARVIELMGKPSHKSRRHAARPRRGRGVRVIVDADRGERWEYQRGDHVTTVTIIDGVVGEIDDRRR